MDGLGKELEDEMNRRKYGQDAIERSSRTFNKGERICWRCRARRVWFLSSDSPYDVES